MIIVSSPFQSFFFFNDTATTEIYTLSLHDALPIFRVTVLDSYVRGMPAWLEALRGDRALTLERHDVTARSEEHTSELQSLAYLVCRLLLEKKKIRTAMALSVASLTHSLSQSTLTEF